MYTARGAVERLQQVPGVRLSSGIPLSSLTRFGIGGPAAVICSASDEESFMNAFGVIRSNHIPHVVVAGGTNLIVADAGFSGVVLRYAADGIRVEGMRIRVDAGASLQAVVDKSIESGLQGMESMTGIPGSLGAAIYGNAGAYGNSIHQRVERVFFTDGFTKSVLGNAECDFRYRESIFKRRKDWVILSAEFTFNAGDRHELQSRATEIRSVRDAKYPPAMKCAGSIFKNCFFADLPASAQEAVPEKLVRDGKVPSAWFLEQVDAKGMTRGEIHVAAYHANLIYNNGAGTASDLVALISELKHRVRDRFGFEIEEEVQYVGFERPPTLL
jgi:UDP-N-acetylmuramate dehydrogenase